MKRAWLLALVASCTMLFLALATATPALAQCKDGKGNEVECPPKPKEGQDNSGGKDQKAATFTPVPPTSDSDLHTRADCELHPDAEYNEHPHANSEPGARGRGDRAAIRPGPPGWVTATEPVLGLAGAIGGRTGACPAFSRGLMVPRSRHVPVQPERVVQAYIRGCGRRSRRPGWRLAIGRRGFGGPGDRSGLRALAARSRVGRPAGWRSRFVGQGIVTQPHGFCGGCRGEPRSASGRPAGWGVELR